MKLSRQKREEISSATIAQALGLIFGFSALFALTALAADPSWWSATGTGAQGAVVAPQVVTNNGVVTTNYIRNDYAVVTQGQLKQFTARAVDELNVYLPGGAGTNLNNMVSGWSNDYLINGYSATNIKPSDYSAMTVGQLKYIGNPVWSRLVAGGYTNAVPSWLAQNTNSDSTVAVLGQLKSIFNFDLSSSSSPASPTIIDNGPINGSVNVLLTCSISASNTPTAYSASGLPPGLSVNGSTGVISGTPTVAGIYNVYLTAANSIGTGSTFIVFNITQGLGAPVINSSLTVSTGAGSSFAYQITASNRPTEFDATNLPSGLSVNSASGVISGTVSTAGTYSINLAATNSFGTATASLTVTVSSSSSGGGQAPVITSSLAASGTAGQSFSYQIAASNNPTSYGASGIPTGLSINTTTGVISGTPLEGGDYSVLISATNASGSTSSFLMMILGYTIPTITSSATAGGAVGSSFSYTLTANNSPTSYSASGLPAGLTFEQATATISGVPTAIGTFSISLGATNASGTGTTTLTLTVSAQGPPVISGPTIAYATVNQAFSYQITASGNPSSYSAAGLPTGLSLNATTGVISGTPTIVRTPNVILTATNSLGAGTSPLIIAVQAATGGVNATLALREGVNPSLGYTTTSAGIGTDTSNVAIASSPIGSLIVGASSSTQINRGLLGFDLSPLPTGATITGASLAMQGNPSSAFTVELHATSPFDPQTANWSDNNSYDSTILSSLDVPYAAGTETWISSAAFVSAVQGKLNPAAADNNMLDLMLVSPDAENAQETSGISQYVTLSNEDMTLASYRPALTINYTTTSPPVIYSVLAGLTVSAYVPYNFAVNAINGASSYSATGLPSGLSINSATGIITGTATATGSYQVTIAATNPNGTGSTTFTLVVVNSTPTVQPVITSPTMAYATVGTAFSYTTTVEKGPVTFSATGLPNGFSINSGTGVLSGTPTSSEVQAFNIAITATNAVGSTTASLLLVVESNSSSATVTMLLQDGISPTSAYETTSAGIAYDSSNSVIADQPDGPFFVGKLSSTQTNRGLLGFDLSVLPPDAVISSAQLVLNAEVSTTSSSTTYGLDLYTPPGPLALEQLSDVENATWNNENNSDPTLVSALTTTLPSAPTEETWASTSAFVSAAQSALVDGTPLFLMVASPALETGTSTDFFLFDNESVPFNPPTATTRPALVLTYTTSAPPVFTSLSNVSGTPGSSFSYQVGAMNGATSYSATGLPDGLSINSAGEISGTATESGTFTVTITAANANGSSTTTVTLNFGTTPAITSPATVNAAVGVAFSYAITASNTAGASPVYSATGLPYGLTLNPSTGVISGTPIAGGGPATVTLGVSTLYGSASASLVITFAPVLNGSALSASGNLLDTFYYPSPFENNPTSFTVSPSNGLSALGLSLDSSGDISGTPTTTTASGGNQVTVTGSNAAGNVSATVNITIDPLPVPAIPTGTATAIDGVSFYYYTDASVATNPNADYISPSNYTATGLPGGLTIDPNYGTVSGTPTDTVTAPTVYTVNITASDDAGSGSGVLSLTLDPPGPGIASPLSASIDIGENFYYELYTWQGDSTTTDATGLPAGLSYQDYGTFGVITGTPTSSGIYDVTLSATDTAGVSTATLVISVGSITSSSTATAQVGIPFTFTVTDSNNPTDFQASNLPQGLSINSSTGVISGTPLFAQTIPISLTVTDAGGSTSSILTLTVNPNSSDLTLSFQQELSPTYSYVVPSANIEYDTASSATANQVFTTGQVLTVGQTTTTAYGRALLDFDLSALPANAVITSASLVMNTSSGNSSGAPLTVEVHQSNAPLVEDSASWNTGNGYNSVVLDSIIIDPAATPGSNIFSFNPVFTGAVQQAYNQRKPLYLTLVAPTVEGQGTPDYISFVTNGTNPSQNPQLIVTYEISAPATPVITSPTVATGTVNMFLSYAITTSNNPTSFSATGLPSGLSVNATTGIITGTVTTVSSTVASVRASNVAGTGTQTVTFNIDTATPATGLQVVSGNNQIGMPGTILAQPLKVQASYNGSPLPNGLVTFTVPAGEGAFTPNNPVTAPFTSTLTVITNANGQALVYYLLPQTLRTTTIVVSAGTAPPVSFVETSALTSTASNSSILLSVISGEGQSGPAGQTLPQPFVIQATTAFGQPLASQALSFTVAQGGGSISTSFNGTFGNAGSTTTNNIGQAILYLKLGGSNGTVNKVSAVATSGGLQSTVYLTALTAQTTSVIAMPGGGTPPLTDQDPLTWNGSVWITKTDEDNGNYTNPDATKITLHWSSAVANVTGFYVEKKIGTGAWSEFNTYNAGQTNAFDVGLQANEEVQYRVRPYINQILGNATTPAAYQVPLIRSISIQTAPAGGAKDGFAEFTDPSIPPKYYINRAITYSESGGTTSYGSSDGDQGNYNSTVSVIPTPDPSTGSLQYNWVYTGASEASGWGSGPQSGSSFTSVSYQLPNGQWLGQEEGSSYENTINGPINTSFEDTILSPSIYFPLSNLVITAQTQTSIIYNYSLFKNLPSGGNLWNNISGTDILSNEYTTDAFIKDVNASLTDYGPWQSFYFGNGYSSAYVEANRFINTTQDEYNLTASQYQWTAYPAKNYHYHWAEVLLADNPTGTLTQAQRMKVMRINSCIFNSSSQTTTSTYTLNPAQYNQYGYYLLAADPQLAVIDGSSTLDNQEKIENGAQASQVTAPPGVSISSSINFGGSGSFTIPENIPSTSYALNWTGSGDSTLQVWGYNNGANAWQQVASGQNLLLGPSDWSGQFVVVATQQAQDNDSINLTLTSTGPDGTQLGTDSSKFYYSKSPPDLSIPIDEASGSRYRKIGLNGLPMGDEKPQQSAESDQEEEETYIDALTLGLRHSTTDAYLPISGSDFSVSARRDFRPQIWNDRNGIRPHESPDLPFGLCWSSNLAPNIKFTHNNDPNSKTPDQAIVTDETGASHTFYRWYDTDGNVQFFPMPSSKNEAQVPNLETLTSNTSTMPVTYVFSRKYGATLTYQVTTLTQSIANDRLLGSTYETTYDYARLIQAVDRLGNTINYQFQGATNLVPATITVANQPGIKLSIQQQPLSDILAGSHSSQSVITAIWDANGNKTTYGYSAVSGDPTAAALTSVSTSDGAVTRYAYDATTEADLTPKVSTDPGSTYSYVDLASITDPLGNAYSFTYAFDHSKQNFMNNSQIPYDSYYNQSGSPRNIATVTMPDNSSSHPDVALFTNNSHIRLQAGQNGNLTLVGQRQNQVTDATGFIRTYTFANPQIVSLPSFPQPANNLTESKIVAYQSMMITYGNLGSENFQFDLNASMALKQTTDFSGNTTQYAHTDQWVAPTNYAKIVSGATLNDYYGDPTSQTDAFGHSKTFTYYGANRIMQSSTDENGNTTYNDIDSLGRRTSEKHYDPSNNLVQETDFAYGSTKYPGFMTQKTVKALGGSGDPSWTADLTTQFVPDANGRVLQEIVDPNGLALITRYTYDANGNKLTAVDPKGNTTWFGYDTRNRLSTVTYADGAQKQMVYDARGNKTIEYDENGIATLYKYDALNRLQMQARDMNGNAVIDVGTDLVTSYTYNNANSKVTTTDPNGNTTTMHYDGMQRVDMITDALSNVTHFYYGANSGGNAFDSSSFKPTESVDPRGVETDVTYDALYRPYIKAVKYDPNSAPAATSTQYDFVGNPHIVTDPLGNQTTTTFDALNRPTLVAYADGTTSHATYSSTGFKWKTADENSHETQTQYDNAGRPVQVTSGIVNNTITSDCPVTKTYYDAAGNMAETVNPRGYAWDYAYDARNRKYQEFEPAVVDVSSNTTARPTMTWQYDPAGRTTGMIDARGNETDTAYDPANRVTDVNQPAVTLGGSTSRPNVHSTYDFNGNVLTLRDPNNQTTVNTYDALNRLHTSTDAANDVVTNGYDQVGNKTSVQDGNLHTTAFEYDGLNRNTKVTDATGKYTKLTYDGMNKTQRVDALGQRTNYFYDYRNRLKTVVYASSATANSQRTYAYDNAGNLSSVTESTKTAANVAYTYDPLNRAITETSQGKTHAYTYDLAGNRQTIVYGGTARQITSTYDPLNRLSTMQDQTAPEVTANTTGRITSYGYDLNGNIVQKTLPNGDSETTSFDVLNRATIQSAQTGGAVSLYTYNYGYDLGGNVTSEAETYPSGLNNRTVTNTYDAINRLHIEAVAASTNVTTTYEYDAANNRSTKEVAVAGSATVSTSYSYNTLNQITAYSDGTRSVALTYDLDGNRHTRVVAGGSDNGTDTYSYNFENRLIGLVKGTSGSAGTYAYQYDYRTRRITRDETNAGGTITALVFSGGTSVQEYDGTTPALSVEYLRGSDYGGGVGGILYTVRSGTPSYTHENKRGDVVAKTDASGNLTFQSQYEAFGKQVATTGSTLDRQKSNSKDTDPTGLVDEGFRYRDLDTGMFISRDPAGFVDGPNLYTYVVQNPWTSFDPEGLQVYLAPMPPIDTILEPRVAPEAAPTPAPPPPPPPIQGPAPIAVTPSPSTGTGPNTAPQSNPTQTQEDQKKENDRTLYRQMRPDPNNPDQPETGKDKGSLGAKLGPLPDGHPPKETVDTTPVDGQVAPNPEGGAGMSTNTDPTKAPQRKGTVLWSIQESQLGPGLKTQPETGPGHVEVQPAAPMTPEQYQNNIHQTQPQWRRVSPTTPSTPPQPDPDYIQSQLT